MAEKKMQLVDWLDDLCVRFIINLPQEELESVARICFQVEEAQWFYEDFIRPIDPSLPSLNLRDFCLRIFQHCPLLSAFSDSQHTAAYQEFLAYKTRVPVRGAILLNDAMDKVVLVKGWKKGASWSFPRGKINKDERDLDCAIREVYEETGYDVKAAGLAPDENMVKAIDVTMREQHLRMFVFRGVPMDTHFEPKTRKEISKIEWYNLADLPTFKKNRQGKGDDLVNANKFYMVAPFLVPLKKWINQQRKREVQNAPQYYQAGEQDILTDAALEELEEITTPAPAVIQPDIQVTADPAAELKRLLSVGASPAAVQEVAAKTEGVQANALLAMLRGGPSRGLAPPMPENVLPTTPLEQITGFPAEPPTPHYHHAKESPRVTQQPPPQFPFSPQHAYPNAPRQTMAPPPGFENHNQQDQHFRGPPGFPPMQQFPRPTLDRRAQGPQGFPNQGPPAPQAASFNPHVPQAPSSQGPVAPKASQLPPPKLTNHTMNLLNAFRSNIQSSAPPRNSGSYNYVQHQSQPAQAYQQVPQQRTQHFPDQRNASAWNDYAAQGKAREAQAEAELAATRAGNQLQQAMQNNGTTQQRWNETFKQTAPQDTWNGGPRTIIGREQSLHGDHPNQVQHHPADGQLATPFATPAHLTEVPQPAWPSQVSAQSAAPSAAQIGRRPSAQQKSLLDLFRSPQAQNAAPVSQPPQLPIGAAQRSVSPAKPAVGAETLSSPERRKVTYNEITRTLPKMKLGESKPPVPSPTSGSMFPAKDTVLQSQANRGQSFNGVAPTTEPQPGPMPAPVKILTRPVSAASKTPSAGVSSAAPSPAQKAQRTKTPPSTGSQLPFTILQRPTSAKNLSPPKTRVAERPEKPASPAKRETEKPFQPQLLRRPKPEDTQGSVETAPLPGNIPAAAKPQDPAVQKDALLALFSKMPKASSPFPQNEMHAPPQHSPSSSGVAGLFSPPPVQDAKAPRSALGSDGSPAGAMFASVGPHERKPSTPMEAKGFLLDYLNGVVGREGGRKK